jgi:hypothetical protein
VIVTPIKKKPRGKPFPKGVSPNPGSVPNEKKRYANGNKTFTEQFFKEMFREVEALENGVRIKSTKYNLFIKQMVDAGIKGNTPARKLVLDFMNSLEVKEEKAEAKQATAGEDIEAWRCSSGFAPLEQNAGSKVGDLPLLL